MQFSRFHSPDTWLVPWPQAPKGVHQNPNDIPLEP